MKRKTYSIVKTGVCVKENITTILAEEVRPKQYLGWKPIQGIVQLDLQDYSFFNWDPMVQSVLTCIWWMKSILTPALRMCSHSNMFGRIWGISKSIFFGKCLNSHVLPSNLLQLFFIYFHCLFLFLWNLH